MDTSNNPTEDTTVATTQTDTITLGVKEYLFEETKQVVTTDVPTQTWVEVMRQMIRHCQPHLKYFDGMKEFIHLVNNNWWRQVVNTDCGLTVQFAEVATLKTRVMSITKYADGLNSAWDGDTFVTETLLLTDTGTILLCTAHHPRKKGADTNGSEKANHLVLKKIDDACLAELIERSYGRIMDLVDSLQEVLLQGIRRRQEQLTTLEDVKSMLHHLQTHIDIKNRCPSCGKSLPRWGSCDNCQPQT